MLFAGLAMLLAGCSVTSKKDESGKQKTVDIKSPFGSMHVNTDSDAKDTGFTVYPNSRPHRNGDKDNGGSVNMSMFGMNLAVATFDTDDPPQKLLDYYDAQVKRYGSVLHCKVKGASGSHNWGREGGSATCEHGEATDVAEALNGDGLELKAGTKDNQHMVVIKQQGQGTQYVLLKIQHGKSGETI